MYFSVEEKEWITGKESCLSLHAFLYYSQILGWELGELRSEIEMMWLLLVVAIWLRRPNYPVKTNNQFITKIHPLFIQFQFNQSMICRLEIHNT